jgi:hypothetical protein
VLLFSGICCPTALSTSTDIPRPVCLVCPEQPVTCPAFVSEGCISCCRWSPSHCPTCCPCVAWPPPHCILWWRVRWHLSLMPPCAPAAPPAAAVPGTWAPGCCRWRVTRVWSMVGQLCGCRWRWKWWPTLLPSHRWQVLPMVRSWQAIYTCTCIIYPEACQRVHPCIIVFVGFLPHPAVPAWCRPHSSRQAAVQAAAVWAAGHGSTGIGLDSGQGSLQVRCTLTSRGICQTLHVHVQYRTCH